MKIFYPEDQKLRLLSSIHTVDVRNLQAQRQSQLPYGYFDSFWQRLLRWGWR